MPPRLFDWAASASGLLVIAATVAGAEPVRSRWLCVYSATVPQASVKSKSAARERFILRNCSPANSLLFKSTCEPGFGLGPVYLRPALMSTRMDANAADLHRPLPCAVLTVANSLRRHDRRFQSSAAPFLIFSMNGVGGVFVWECGDLSALCARPNAKR